MAGAELQALADDIKKHGQRAPATLYEGMILDGRNRVKACEMAGKEVKTRDFSGTDPLEFVLSVNLHRRHLSPSQRAMIAVEIAKLHDAKNHPANLRGKNHATEGTKIASAQMSVGSRTVESARVVKSDPALSAAVVNGTKSVHAAVKEIRAKKAEKEVRLDTTGYAIPEELFGLWDRRGEVQAILTAIGKARGAIRTVMESQKEGVTDPLYLHANLSGAQAHLHNAWTSISMALPHAVCASCQGRAKETCKVCKTSGFVPKHTFENAFPPELIAIREKSCVKP